MDRRTLIKRSTALGGALWAAPSILNATVAGADIVDCYFCKANIPHGFGSGSTSDGSCNSLSGYNAARSAAVAAATSNDPNATLGSCSTLNQYASGSGPDRTIVLPAGSVVYFVGAKWGNTCAFIAPVNNAAASTSSGCGTISWNPVTATVTIDGTGASGCGLSHYEIVTCLES